MQIESSIDFWGEEVTTFDPEKVLNKLKMLFPDILIDPEDYSQNEVKRFTEYAESNISEPQRSKMIKQIQEKNRRNGPVFQFSIVLDENKKINGYVKRYRVFFESEDDISGEIKNKIMDFLKSINLGEVTINK